MELDDTTNQEPSDPMQVETVYDNPADVQQRLLQLKDDLKLNPYDYSKHEELVELAVMLQDPAMIRQAREDWSKYFILSETSTLNWIMAEQAAMGGEKDRNYVWELYKRVLKELPGSVNIWSGYCLFCEVLFKANVMSADELREVYKESVSLAGRNPKLGGLLWDQQIEFEKELDNVSDKNAHIERIRNIYKSCLSIPLLQMEEIYEDWEDWEEEDLGNKDPICPFEDVYKNTFAQIEELSKFEEKIDDEIATTYPNENELKNWWDYIEYYKNKKVNENTQCMYERMVLKYGHLVPRVWLEYIDFMNSFCKNKHGIMIPLLKRSVKAYPYDGQIRSTLLKALERAGKQDEIHDFCQESIQFTLNTSNDYVSVILAYLEYVTRNCNIEDETSIENARGQFQQCLDFATNYLSQEIHHIDEIEHFWAIFESYKLKDHATARKYWNSIIKRNKKYSQYWIEYTQAECTQGEVDKCRALYKRCVNQVNDSLAYILWGNWVNFERIYGNLPQLETALRIVANLQEKLRISYSEQKKQRGSRKRKNESDSDSKPAKKRKIEQKKDTNPLVIRVAKIPTDTDDVDAVLTSIFEEFGIKEIRSKYDKFSKKFRGLSFIEFETEEGATQALEVPVEKLTIEGQEMKLSRAFALKQENAPVRYTDKQTLFISGLSPETTTEKLTEIISECMAIKAVRIVTDKISKISRGFGYISVFQEEDMEEIIKFLNGKVIDGSEVEVAVSNPPKKRGPGARRGKYSGSKPSRKPNDRKDNRPKVIPQTGGATKKQGFVPPALRRRRVI
eukprot:TRINITY_DN612_c0_g1_i1.p1 TRINITY_DN612_c0_g1~~TRINITY_DN612_c0_g1_i1.p1  ORF type:complete len:791 (+),score=179.65 TRINITY_DN612_c0_g1_i1:410-2782(+)